VDITDAMVEAGVASYADLDGSFIADMDTARKHVRGILEAALLEAAFQAVEEGDR